LHTALLFDERKDPRSPEKDQKLEKDSKEKKEKEQDKEPFRPSKTEPEQLSEDVIHEISVIVC
jgi:hypothetical protein